MRTTIAAIVVGLQLAVLAGMAVQREWIVRTGRPILLRTAPIDPNDPMRGEYAHFTYDISVVPREQWQGGLKARFPTRQYDFRAERDLAVYALLRPDDLGVLELLALTDERPASGLFLRGRVQDCYGDTLRVRYGIEAMFLQQGKSQQLENAQRQERRGAAIDVEAAVNNGGVAALTGYHWEQVGLTATFEREPAPVATTASPTPFPNGPGARRQVVVAAKLEFKNYGPGDVALALAPDGGSFRLVPAGFGGMAQRYRWRGAGRPVPAPRAADVIVLPAGQTHVTRIDLTRPEWFVVEAVAAAGRSAPDAKPVALRDVTDAWAASFRLEYVPPAKSTAASLPHADMMWFGRLRSRVFNGAMGGD